MKNYEKFHENMIYSICCFKLKDNFMFSSDVTGCLKLLNLDKMKLVKNLGKVHFDFEDQSLNQLGENSISGLVDERKGKNGAIRVVTVTRDRRFLFTGDECGVLKVWNVKRGVIIKSYSEIARNGIYALNYK